MKNRRQFLKAAASVAATVAAVPLIGTAQGKNLPPAVCYFDAPSVPTRKDKSKYVKVAYTFEVTNKDIFTDVYNRTRIDTNQFCIKTFNLPESFECQSISYAEEGVITLFGMVDGNPHNATARCVAEFHKGNHGHGNAIILEYQRMCCPFDAEEHRKWHTSGIHPYHKQHRRIVECYGRTYDTTYKLVNVEFPDAT